MKGMDRVSKDVAMPSRTPRLQQPASMVRKAPALSMKKGRSFGKGKR